MIKREKGDSAKNLFSFKGTALAISSYLQTKTGILDSQRYSLNICLYKNIKNEIRWIPINFLLYLLLINPWATFFTIRENKFSNEKIRISLSSFFVHTKVWKVRLWVYHAPSIKKKTFPGSVQNWRNWSCLIIFDSPNSNMRKIFLKRI